MDKGIFNSHLRPSIIFLGLFTLLFGVIYPMITTVVLQLAFTDKANGSLILEQDKIVASYLIGQPFSDPKYFWSRPSATEPFPYNSIMSGGSNLSATNPNLIKNIKNRINLLRQLSPTPDKKIPVDLVTSSASGLDPHISIASALYQVSRIAQLRKINEQRLIDLVEQCTEERQYGVLGEPRVNVVELNLALDKEKVL